MIFGHEVWEANNTISFDAYSLMPLGPAPGTISHDGTTSVETTLNPQGELEEMTSSRLQYGPTVREMPEDGRVTQTVTSHERRILYRDIEGPEDDWDEDGIFGEGDLGSWYDEWTGRTYTDEEANLLSTSGTDSRGVSGARDETMNRDTGEIESIEYYTPVTTSFWSWLRPSTPTTESNVKTITDSSIQVDHTILGPGGTQQTPTPTLSLPTQTTVSDNRPIGKILLIGVTSIVLYSVLTKN